MQQARIVVLLLHMLCSPTLYMRMPQSPPTHTPYMRVCLLPPPFPHPLLLCRISAQRVGGVVVVVVARQSLAAAGCDTAEVLEKSVPESGSALIGDLADEISADLVLLSSEAVHTKQVDANLLAEFVGCPVLLLP